MRLEIFVSIFPSVLKSLFDSTANENVTQINCSSLDLVLRLDVYHAMEASQSIPRKPVNSFYSYVNAEPVEITLGGFNRGSRNDTATANNALLDGTEVKHSEQSHDFQRHWLFTGQDWGWELLAWAASVVALCAIVIVLLVFNHQPLSHWPYRIKLNTLVSIFAQISSTALAIPLSECISQLKWLWFTRRNQPLSDFDSFDKASRGPWSSLLLIWKTRASHLVSFGALLVVANLAFQSFVQQAVSFPQRLISNGTATVTTVHNLTNDVLQGGTNQDLNVGGYLPPSTVASIYAGLNGGITLSEVSPSCPTGNCTFAPYESLALCANPVANISHLLNRAPYFNGSDVDCSTFGTQSTHICNYSLPNGAYLAGEDMYTNITSNPLNGTNLLQDLDVYRNIKSIAFRNTPLVLDFFMIYYSSSINNVAAIEASLSFCGQTYNSSVLNGKTNTTELDRWGTLNTSNVIDWYPMWPLVGNSTTFWIEQGYVTSLQATLSSIFSGYREVNDNAYEIFSSVAVQALNNTLVGSKDDIATLQSFMDELAVSISNNFRTGTGSVVVNGVNDSVETYVSVDWFWLIFPSFVVLFTLVFLLSTIVKNRRRGTRTWKSSSLAVLSGLSIDTKDKFGYLTSLGKIQERGKGTRVRLVEGNGKWQLIAE